MVNYRFKNNEKTWSNAKECFFCQKKFKKVGMRAKRHHCRLCTKSCCGSCSTNSVKGHKVCDICFTKDNNQSIEIQKKMYMRFLETNNLNLEEKIKTIKNEIANKEKRASTLSSGSETQKKLMIQRISDIESQLERLREIYDSKIAEKRSIEVGISQNSDMEETRNKSLSVMQSQTDILRIDVENLKRNYGKKKEHLDSLKRLYGEIHGAETSFVNSLSHPENDNDMKITIIEELARKTIGAKRELEREGITR